MNRVLEGATLYNNAVAFADQYHKTGDLSRLRSALELISQAVDLTEQDPAVHSRIRSAYGAMLRDLFMIDSDVATLNAAVEHSRAAVDRLGDGAGPHELLNLAAVLGTVFLQVGDPRALEEAIGLNRQAMALTGRDVLLRQVVLSNLANDLTELYEIRHDPAVLDEAIDVAERAVAGPDIRPGAIVNQALALRRRYHDRGAPEDLDKAIALARQVVEISATAPFDRPRHLDVLGGLLADLYDRTGDTATLDEAIEAGRAAVAGSPPADPECPGRESSLANLLIKRYQRSHEIRFLEEARRLSAHAQETMPVEHLDRDKIDQTHDDLERFWHERQNLAGAASHRIVEELDQAIAEAEANLAHLPEASSARPAALGNLGLLLKDRFLRDGSRDDLDTALTRLRDSMRYSPPNSHERALAGLNLGLVLFHRLLDQSKQPDSAESEAVAREVALLEAESEAVAREVALLEAAPSWARAQGARAWGAWSAQRADWATAVEAYNLALALLPEIAPEDFHRTDAEFHLGRLPVLASDTAACLLNLRGEAGALEALRVLEQGRGVLLAQALRRRRDTSAADVDRVYETASSGPIVLVNVTDIRSDALIVTGQGVRCLPLPWLTLRQTEERYRQFAEALDILDRQESSALVLRLAERSLLEVFSWLWDHIAGPVLSQLRIGGTASPSRVWWCPTGVLSLLPLHAAGQYPDGPAAIDCVISSYTPTIRALGRARDRSSRPALGSGKTIVALPETPGEAELPAALIEAGQFVSRFPDAISLIGPRASRAGVVEAIQDAAWLHFACHAQSDQSDPSAGHLSLHDGPLPLSEIAEFDLLHTELAYLSACETAIGSSRLADESLHIAAAFQLAGYPHVVGTLWTIRDILAARISDSVYERIAKHGIADTARHLNDAVHALVRDRPGLRSRPWLWAGHVHIGP